MDDPVIQIVRGQASDEECAAVVAVLTAALHRARLAAARGRGGGPSAPGARALWDGDPRPAYRCPRSWQSADIEIGL
jgi:hypothetical protein